MAEEKVFVSVWRSSRKEGMYLYLPRGAAFEELDEILRKHFGAPEHAMDLVLHAGRKLARADVTEVLAALRDKGFYLQMPPGDGADIYMPPAGGH